MPSIVPLLLVVRTTIVEGRRLLGLVRARESTFANVEASIAEVTGMDVDIAAALRNLVRDCGIGAFGDNVSIVGTLAHVAIGMGLTLFLR